MKRLISNIVLAFGLATILLTANIGSSAQVSTSDSPQNKETAGKADQNLKSIARVNPSTLAMEMNLPLMTYPGRNGNSVPVGFSYSSKIWRMQSRLPWWDWVNTHRVYITDIVPMFSEKKSAGWTSTLSSPLLEEETQVYNENGQPYQEPIDALTLNSQWQNTLSAFTSSNNMPDIYGCQGFRCCTTYWCMPIGDDDYQCTCTRWVDNETGGGGIDPPPQEQIPLQLYYVRKFQVTMADGATHEFRASDSATHCGNTNTGCPISGNGNGTYLSVDGSGMKLVKDNDGTTLFMPNGSRYDFPAVSPTPSDGNYATQFIDSDGNKMAFKSTFDISTGRYTRKWIDTMGREIIDPLQSRTGSSGYLGEKPFSLPGLEEQPQNYSMTWSNLKPPGCEEDTTGNCVGTNGQSDGALEDQTQKLYFEARYMCQGNSYIDLQDDPDTANQILFPEQDTGIVPCNGFDVSYDANGNVVTDSNGTPITHAPRFNPVVLSEVKLPNGKTYQFKYNRYGEITKIVYPSGSYETFVYDRITPLAGINSDAYDQTNRGVVEREVYRKLPDGNFVLEQHWQYSAGFINNSYVITTTAPKGDNATGNGIRTERYLFADGDTGYNFGFDSPLGGMVYEERVYAEGDYVNPRSRTLTKWKTKDITSGGVTVSRDPRVEQTVSVRIENGQALATLTSNTYDENGSTDPEHFSHLNAKSSKNYHYKILDLNTAKTANVITIAGVFTNADLASISETDYQYDSNYKAHGIPSLPVETRVLNPANTTEVIAKIQTVYDNIIPAPVAYPYSIQTYSGISTSLDCSTDPQVQKICWENPNQPNGISLTYRGKPTTSRVWDKDNNTLIDTHTQYDQFGNVVKTKDPIGNEAQTTFTANYRYAYPEAVNTSAPDPTGTHGTMEGSTASTTYDPTTGLPLTVTNNFGQTTATEYNDDLLRPTKVYGVGTFVIPITETTYDDNALTVTVRKQIDANTWDEATIYSDSFGRTIKTRSKDSQGDVFVETEYDFLGRVKRTTNPYRLNEPNLTKYWSASRYDEMGRSVESYAPAPDGQNGASLGVIEYGISTAPGFVGTYVLTTDAAGKKGRSITNALGQLVRVDEPSSLSELDPLPQSTPNPTPTPTPGGGGPTGGCLTPENCPQNLTGNDYPMNSTTYKYDERGNLIEVNQGEQTRTFTYDSFSRIKSATNPESGTVSYTYDVLGNLKTKRDARGIKTIYDYDKWDRIINRCYRVIGSGALGAKSCAGAGSETVEPNTPDVSYFYDGKGLSNPQTPNYAKGKLTKISSSVSETLFASFDDHGRVLIHQQITGGETYSTSYKYDFKGALVEQTYPSGKVVRNFYDTDGDLSQVVKNGKNYASDFSYTAAGAIEKMKLGNGNWEAAVYNERLQPIQIGLGNSQNNTTNLWQINYEYGELNADGTTVNPAKNNGNVAKQIITVPTIGSTQGFTATQTYTYDSLNRLKQAKETIPNQTGWQQTFSYDRFGNRSIVEAETDTFAKLCSENSLPALCENDRKLLNPSVNQANNRLTVEQGYEYDANGNMTKDAEGKTFTYDALNKQTEVKNSSDQSLGRYIYDGEGKRIKKLGNLENTVFVYDAFGSLIAEYAIDNPQPNPSPNISYLTTDTLGSPRIITGKEGEVLSRRDFLPFGEEIIANEANRKAALGYNYGNSSTRQSFTSYEEDLETDLEFAQNRYYANKHGRFTTADPLMASGKVWSPQSWNRYVYVKNNPLNLTDPLGLDGCDPKKEPCPIDPPKPDGSLKVGLDENGAVEISFGEFTSVPKIKGKSAFGHIKDFLTKTIPGVFGFNTGTGTPTLPAPPTIPIPTNPGPGPIEPVPPPDNSAPDPSDGGSGGGGAGSSPARDVALAIMIALAQKYINELLNGKPLEDGYVYRSGGFTKENLTPNFFKETGKSDFNGLSVSLDPPATGNYQKLDVKILRSYGLNVINDHGRHAAIVPPTARELVIWALSRKLPGQHTRTTQVMNARVGDRKNP